MKKMFFALMVMLTTTMTASAMSYEQARSEALFLTDKMAYELNLTDEQYEAAYEINLDYLMGVTGRADVFGTYWERRNLDLSYILLDWQWNAYIAASYFYRPLYWDAGYWHFGVYRRYPHRDYFFFGRPHFYATYRGGHAWHVHGGHGYYYGHREHFRSSPREHFGMHDRWNRGDFRGPGHSSTRVTAGPGRGGNHGGNIGGYHGDNHRGRIGNNAGGSRPTNPGNGTVNRRPGNSFGGSYGGSSSGNSNVNRMSAHRYGSSNKNNGTSGVRQNGSYSGGGFSSKPSHSSSGGFSSRPSHSNGGGSFSGGTRSGSSHSGGFSGGSRSSGFSGGSHSSGGSHGGGSHGGGSHGGGGGHFGGHR
ncbi:MAG: hypothetical protein IJQ60_01670 [Prevotella sp.]|nr:hypothetical protein [Prevotella sp.]